MTTITAKSRTVDVPGATLTYDVRGPLPSADGSPPLLLIGQPMDASGFTTLASHFPDRTVVTYDPRGLGRSVRYDGSTVQTPERQADDLHALIAELGDGPVDLFGSSGGAVTGLCLAPRHPQDVRIVVAHEPPLQEILPDAEEIRAAWYRLLQVYQERGWGWAMAAFIALAELRGPVPAGFGTEVPDPATFGLPTDDDGSRDDPLLSGAAAAIIAYRPDAAALTAGPVRVVVAGGVESEGTIAWRAGAAVAELLGTELVEFPGDHGGFLGGEFGQTGKPEAFAARLKEVLAKSA